MKDVALRIREMKDESGAIKSLSVRKMEMADGSVDLAVEMDDSYYYQILSDYVGLPIGGEYELMQTLSGLARMQNLCDHLGNPEKELQCIHIAGTNGKAALRP